MRRTRFAPSPTGALHVGHAFSASFAADQGERFIVRIEDIDHTRCKPQFVDAIFDDLRWLGLQWEEPVIAQSQRHAAYAQALAELDGLGVTYPCFCSRKDIAAQTRLLLNAPHGPDGPHYPGTCRDLDPREREARLDRGDSHLIRLHCHEAFRRIGLLEWHDLGEGQQTADPRLLGDIALSRKDIGVAYHLCVVVDDDWQKIDVVTRGYDLFDASAIHRTLQALLNLNVPTWHHHGMLVDANNQRLAKRKNSPSLANIRQLTKQAWQDWLASALARDEYRIVNSLQSWRALIAKPLI